MIEIRYSSKYIPKTETIDILTEVLEDLSKEITELTDGKLIPVLSYENCLYVKNREKSYLAAIPVIISWIDNESSSLYLRIIVGSGRPPPSGYDEFLDKIKDIIIKIDKQDLNKTYIINAIKDYKNIIGILLFHLLSKDSSSNVGLSRFVHRSVILENVNDV